MIKIIKWAQKKLADTVDDIWCIHCGVKRTVINHGVVETTNPKGPVKRLIGECTICEGSTSTFV